MKIQDCNVVDGSARVIRGLGPDKQWAVMAKDPKGRDVPLDWSPDESKMRALADKINRPAEAKEAAA